MRELAPAGTAPAWTKVARLATMRALPRMAKGGVATAAVLCLAACSVGQSGVSEEDQAASAAAIEKLEPGLDPRPLDSRETVVAAIPGVGEAYAALTLADAMGEFDKENIDVQIEVVSPASSILALMDQGEVDVTVTAAFAGMYNQVAAGSKLAFVTGGGEISEESPSGWWQRVGSDGQAKCEDLDGKRIGISTGAEANPLAWSLSRYLDSCGLTFSDVELAVFNSHPEMVIALENEAVELAIVGFPFSQPLIDSDDFEFVSRWDNGIAGTVMGNLLYERPEVAQAVVRAMLRTVRTHLQGNYYEDPDVLRALSEIVGVDEQTLADGFPRTFDPEFAPAPEVIEGVEKFWFDNGGILAYDEPVAERMTDSSLLDSIKE